MSQRLEENFANFMPDKRLLFRIYKELTKLTNNLKWTKF